MYQCLTKAAGKKHSNRGMNLKQLTPFTRLNGIGIIQRCGGYFANTRGYTFQTVKRRVDKGEDVVAFPKTDGRFYALPTIDFSRASYDEEYAELLTNAEDFGRKILRWYEDDKKGADFRRRSTEILGELAAAMYAARQDYEPVYTPGPGHGTGFDQVYRKGNEVIVIEAKGPGADLSAGQMSLEWIKSRAKRMGNKEVGSLITSALEGKGGLTLTRKVVRARIDGDKLRYSVTTLH